MPGEFKKNKIHANTLKITAAGYVAYISGSILFDGVIFLFVTDNWLNADGVMSH